MSNTLGKLIVSTLYKFIESRSNSVSPEKLLNIIGTIEIITNTAKIPDIYVKKSNILLHKLNSNN